MGELGDGSRRRRGKPGGLMQVGGPSAAGGASGQEQGENLVFHVQRFPSRAAARPKKVAPSAFTPCRTGTEPQPSLASAAPMADTTALSAFSGRIMTLNRVMRPLSSHSTMSTPLT